MVSQSSKETKDFARNLLQSIQGPTVLALEGDLGAGKTTFVQGVAEQLRIQKRVLSPTFVFLRSYDIDDKRFKKFHHFDLYRCQNLEDVKSIGLPEVLAEVDSLIAIEWPVVAKELLPKDSVWVNFKKIDENSRQIQIS